MFFLPLRVFLFLVDNQINKNTPATFYQCFLEALKYLKTSKQHGTQAETPGIYVVLAFPHKIQRRFGSPNASKRPKDVLDRMGKTPLHVACSAGHTRAVHLLLDAKASLETRLPFPKGPNTSLQKVF